MTKANGISLMVKHEEVEETVAADRSAKEVNELIERSGRRGHRAAPPARPVD